MDDAAAVLRACRVTERHLLELRLPPYWAGMYSTVLGCTALHCAGLLLHCIALCWVVLHCAGLQQCSFARFLPMAVSA